MYRRLTGLLSAAVLFIGVAVLVSEGSSQAVAAATVTSVTSTTPSGTYVPGDVISIQVNFSEPVTAGGGVAMILETGPTDRTIRTEHRVNDTTSTFTFSYTVQVGDRSADLDVQSIYSFLPGEYTLIANGVNANITLPAPGAPGSLSANSDIVITGVGADEQWSSPLASVRSLHGFNLSEDQRENVSYLGLAPGNARITTLCISTTDAACAGKALTYRAVLPMCSGVSQLDCISEVSAESTAVTAKTGIFEKAFPAVGEFDFTGSPARKIPSGGTSSILRFPDFPHTTKNGVAIDTYAVTVSLSGTNNANDTNVDKSFFASITPVSIRETTCDGRYNGGRCMDGIAGSVAVDQDGGYRCTMWDVIDGNNDRKIETQDPSSGDKSFCTLKQGFPKDIRFTLKVRLSQEPKGWLHGRMNEPSINFESTTTQTNITISAGPVRVPVYAGVAPYVFLPRKIKDYFDSACGPGGIGCGGRFPEQTTSTPANLRTGYEDNPPAYSARAFSQIALWKDFMNDTASAMPSHWNVRTLSTGEMNSAPDCVRNGKGVTGIVTTNSTAYFEGPPAFDADTKSLKYEVSSPHYENDGKTEFKGVYNLAVRSDIAECIYKFSSAFAAPAAPVQFNNETDAIVDDTVPTTSDVYVEEAPYVDESNYANQYPASEDEIVETTDGSYEMYEDAETVEVSLAEYVSEEADLSLTQDKSADGKVIPEGKVFAEDVVASVDALVVTELQKSATANTSIELANGWFKFSATNFTFSKPTVKVSFAATPAKVIACISGATIKFVKAVRPACPPGSQAAKTLYCVKGKAVSTVVAAAPKCSKGKVVAKSLTCAKGGIAVRVVAVTPKCAKGFSKVKTFYCVKNSTAREIHAVRVKCNNGFSLATRISCKKGKQIIPVTASRPVCPKGFKRK
jgi:hypothetical protein